jgi:hypothetical protein
MKKIFLITYSFRDPREVPQEFYEALTGFTHWSHYMDGSWLIATDLDAAAIRDRFEPFLGDGMYFLTAEVGPDMAGWLPRQAWEWVRKHRSAAVRSEEVASHA